MYRAAATICLTPRAPCSRSCPLPPKPQHVITPDAASAHACSSPDATETIPMRLAGALAAPKKELPQHCSAVESVATHEWKLPADKALISVVGEEHPARHPGESEAAAVTMAVRVCDPTIDNVGVLEGDELKVLPTVLLAEPVDAADTLAEDPATRERVAVVDTAPVRLLVGVKLAVVDKELVVLAVAGGDGEHVTGTGEAYQPHVVSRGWASCAVSGTSATFPGWPSPQVLIIAVPGT